MPTLWFCLVAAMIAVYVLLDGFDLGAGIIFLGVAHTDAERRAALASIGPFWDANEVWLIAGGGTIFFAFPRLYASSFSGFYLPLMMVLWLLMARGVSLEFRSHIAGPLWAPFWDVVFCFSSVLLAVFFGAALGNVVRGVPLDASGSFFEPLWTNFTFGADAGILDWYTILAGVAAYLALAEHGALWIAWRCAGQTEVAARARRIARMGAWPLALVTILLTAVTLRIQPQIRANLAARPWGFLFPALAIAGLAGIFLSLSGFSRRSGLPLPRSMGPPPAHRAFFASCAYLVGMLTSAAFGLYPYVLPARGGPSLGLTIENASTTEHGMRLGLAWWIVGMTLATFYFVFLYRRFSLHRGSAGRAADVHY